MEDVVTLRRIGYTSTCVCLVMPTSMTFLWISGPPVNLILIGESDICSLVFEIPRDKFVPCLFVEDGVVSALEEFLFDDGFLALFIYPFD